MDFYDVVALFGFLLLIVGVGLAWGGPAGLMVAGFLLIGFGLFGAR